MRTSDQLLGGDTVGEIKRRKQRQPYLRQQHGQVGQSCRRMFYPAHARLEDLLFAKNHRLFKMRQDFVSKGTTSRHAARSFRASFGRRARAGLGIRPKR